MSVAHALANPHRIKASHRRRRPIASGQSVQRYYDPAIGRFISVDPVDVSAANGSNFNRYWYANNNPYRYTDPDGRFGVSASYFNYQANSPQARQAQASAIVDSNQRDLGTLADFTPGVGDVKGIAEAIGDPTPVNIIAAAAGLVPVAGDAVAKGLKGANKLADGASTAVEITRGATRNSPDQISVGATSSSVQAELVDSGYTVTRADNGDGVSVLQNGDKQYTFYPSSTSGGVPSADVRVNGETTSKLRFQEER